MVLDNSFNKSLRKSILTIAIPISLQSFFQSSLSVIDQIMVGQLGSSSITSIGIGSKFPNLYIITLAAIGTAASIMISQYCGSEDETGVNNAFAFNTFLASLITGVFLLSSVIFPKQIIKFYTADSSVIDMSAKYLRIIAVGYIPLLCTTMLSAMLRNTGNAKSPMIASIMSVTSNTLLNYILIFGKFGVPALGAIGTAFATTTARIIECLILFYLFLRSQKKSIFKIHIHFKVPSEMVKQTMTIASPIVINEFLWGFGDTIYSAIYGHIGTEPMAAMMLTMPIQSLAIGLFTGVSSAAAILVGNHLGKGEKDSAYALSAKFMKFGVIGSLGIGGLIFLFSGIYSRLFHVSSSTRQVTVWILYVFAAVMFVKVSNMILGGGILRSGGKTKYTLFLDILGTWGIGVPLGLAAAFIWHLPIEIVYLLISTEEVVRLVLSIFVFKTGKWMKQITADAA